MDTLKLFKVGVGQEKFFCDIAEDWQSYECVYFPMFAPVSEKVI